MVILCGPPGAGKTTAARASGLQVFDRDDDEWSSEAQFRRRIADLSRTPTAQAVVIRAGASSSARAKAAVLVGATHTFLLTEHKRELAHRVATRNRADKVTGLASIRTWFDKFDDRDGVRLFPGWDALDLGVTSGATSREW